MNPVFFDNYVTHVCPVRASPAACVARFKIPPLPKQIVVNARFHDIRRAHAIDGLEGLVLLDLIEEDEDDLAEVLSAADAYYASLDYLRARTAAER